MRFWDEAEAVAEAEVAEAVVVAAEDTKATTLTTIAHRATIGVVVAVEADEVDIVAAVAVVEEEDTRVIGLRTTPTITASVGQDVQWKTQKGKT